MIQVHCFEFSPFAENTYVLSAPSGECLIIDPGCYTATEEITLKQFIENSAFTPKALLNTHAHIDHIFGNRFVKDTWKLPLYLSDLDIPLFERADQMAALWGLSFAGSPHPDENLVHGQILQLADDELEVRFVPGHAPGHMVFVSHSNEFAICGDTLFAGSIGRTDLPGGNHELLLQSIREQLFTLPDHYTLYPGHGPSTTVGAERKSNPFFQGT
jgi:glyoxylase-like metal-dependent hydrolase (beta-lactamase superfamily II)